jgi:hypothetical protein
MHISLIPGHYVEAGEKQERLSNTGNKRESGLQQASNQLS